MEKASLPHPDHDRHLCNLTNLHFHQTNWIEYKKLVEGARYICKNCGRCAAEKDRLCSPMKL
jgi:hypothetical protein